MRFCGVGTVANACVMAVMMRDLIVWIMGNGMMEWWNDGMVGCGAGCALLVAVEPTG